MPEPTATERFNTPLLTLITQQSLDEDYRHVAERRAGAGQPSGRRPHRVAAVVVAVFGLMVTVAAVQTSERAGVTDASRASLIDKIETGRGNVASMQRRIVRLRAVNAGLQEDLDQTTASQQAAASRAGRLRAVTGFGAVTGPGVVITVDDAPGGDLDGVVKDEDLATLVNGLWSAGAEAISINGQRLTARSAIRASGAAIRVNSRSLSPPYVVQAIGDPDSLQADLIDTSGGLAFFDVANQFGMPHEMDNEDQLSLPAAPGRLLRLRSAADGTAAEHRNQRHKEAQQ